MNPLAALHVAKKQLDLTEEDYRAVLERVTGRRSARELAAVEIGLVLDEFRRMGFMPTPGRSRMPKVRRSAKGAMLLDGPYAAKLRALWIAGWNLGVVRDRTDKALLAFVERQTKISHTRFLREAGDASKAIEALKAWLAREAGVVWPKAPAKPYETKRAVIEAQIARLGLPAGASAQIVDLDGYAAELGVLIREKRT